MKDARTSLLTGLYEFLTAKCNATVYTRMPKSSSIVYPYIQIGDIYDDEGGAKDEYRYNYDVLINIVYKDVTSLVDFHNDISNVKSAATKAAPFSINQPFNLLETSLISASSTEFEDEDGSILNVCAIRIDFYISED